MELTLVKNHLDSGGRLVRFPTKQKGKLAALLYLAEKFESDRRYTEKEVSELLAEWHTFHDPCTLRRELYNRRFLNREPDGSAYWLEEIQPTLESLGLSMPHSTAEHWDHS